MLDPIQRFIQRRRADFVIDTSQSLEHAFEQVKSVVDALKGRKGKALTDRLKE